MNDWKDKLIWTVVSVAWVAFVIDVTISYAARAI